MAPKSASDVRVGRAERRRAGRVQGGDVLRRWRHGLAGGGWGRGAPRPAGGGVPIGSGGRLALVVVGGMLLGGIAGGDRRSGSPMAPAAAESRPDRGTPVVPAADGLARRIDALLDDEPGVYGVVVATAGGEIRYARNEDAPFIAASLYKPFVMAAVLEARTAGTLRLDEAILVENVGWITVDDALRAMITWSSNEAAQALYERVGIEAVNRAAADLGLDQTRMARNPTTLPGWPPVAGQADPVAATDQATRFVLASASDGYADVTTPREMATFFSLLLEGKVVNRRASARMLQTLLRQEVDDRFPARLPKRTAVAHKTGNLPGVVHDAGVIYAPDGPVVLVALAEDVPDEARAVEVIRRLAVLVHRAHGGEGPRRRSDEGTLDPVTAASPVVIGPPPVADDRRVGSATPTRD